MKLNTQELDTVLAALRCGQRTALVTGEGPEWAIAEEHGSALDTDAIDALCERLNCGNDLELAALASFRKALAKAGAS
jgi:hypothetical protein